MTYETGPVEDRAAWDALLKTHLMPRSIVPLWDVLAGWRQEDLGLYESGRLIGGTSIAFQQVPVLPVFLSRINFVMVGPNDRASMLRALLAGVERFNQQRRIVETELRLRIPSTAGIAGFEDHEALRGVIESSGYQPLAKADTTYFVDLDRPDEVILKSFKSEYRNRIRKANKAGATVEATKDLSLLEPFADAYVEMVTRKGAPAQPKEQIGQGLRPLIEKGHAQIFVERYDDRFANMLIVDMLGIPVYALGTRSRAHVQGKMPGAAQVLHFEVMRQLRDAGHRYYDLGGCQGPVPIDTDPNYGTWRFKYGFRPTFVRFLPYFRKIRAPFEKPLLLAHRARGDYL